MKKGFTLIELLIVVTIIAILAGAAIPFVQDYVEQAKVARVRQDLNEIRNGLARWEIDRGVWLDGDVTIAKLLGPYLSKPLVDPWGGAYVISNTKSTVYSKGPNGTDDLGINDDITLTFRPRMAITRVEYLDVNGNGSIDVGDTISFTATRPPLSPYTGAVSHPLSGITISGVAVNGIIQNASNVAVGRKLITTLSGSPAIAQGALIDIGSSNSIRDSSGDASTQYAKEDLASLRLLSAN